MAADVVGAFRQTFGDVSDRMHTAHDALKVTTGRLYDRAKRVAEQEHLVVWPKATAEACCVAAFAVLKRKQLFEQHCWVANKLQPIQRTFGDKYPTKDFHFWVMYGSWSCCQHCGSVHFNDAYFKEDVYKDIGASLPHVPQVPSEPMEHCYGSVGISSRWWYRPGMYKPLAHCHRRTQPPEKLEDVMAYKQKHPEPQPVVESTGELYVIPCIFPAEQPLLLGQYRRDWPLYNYGTFQDGKSPDPQYAGESLLELDLEEQRALQIVELRTVLQKEEFGARHQFNWKKVGLSRACFKQQLVTEEAMPTLRAKAA